MSFDARLRPAASAREARAVARVAALAAARGVPSAAGILRAGSAVLVGLPDAGVLARVDEPARADDARRQVAVARALAERGVPAARLADHLAADQPVAVDGGGQVTLWSYVEPIAEAPTPGALGALARQLHDAFRHPAPGGSPGRGLLDGVVVGPPPPGLPRLDPVVGIERHLAEVDAHGDTAAADLGMLRAELVEAAGAWAAVAAEDPLGWSLVHGDLHGDNALVSSDGPVLVDLEQSGVGPASYDLVPQLVGVRRYGRPVEGYRGFCDAYGFDVASWDGSRAMVRLYELSVTAWAVATRGISARHEREAVRRLATLWHPAHADDDEGRWSLL